MAQPTNGSKRFQVHLSGQLALKIRQIQEQASIEGRGQEVLTAFRTVVQRLMNDPYDFGEPLYRLPALRMQIRHGAILPLFIDYGVYEDRPFL